MRKLLQYEGLSENTGCRQEEMIHMRAPTEDVITSSPLKEATSFTLQIDSDSKSTGRNVETRKNEARSVN